MSGGLAASVVWQDVECGGYADDLELWEELARGAAGPLLELGCGSGRVALHLARRGHEVWGVERDGALAEELCARARAAALPVRVACADLRTFDLGAGGFALVLAPMQVVQLLDGADARRQALRRARDHLRPGGLVAIAIVEGTGAVTGPGHSPPLPDVREREGWIYSSLPLEIAARGDRLEVRRLRQVVSPAGELSEETDLVRLAVVDAGAIEADAREAGLVPAGRLAIPSSEAHVGSTVVTARREGG